MKKRVEFLVGVLITAMVSMVGIGILSGRAHSQNKAEEVAANEEADSQSTAQGDMAEVLDLLDVISQDTETILDIQDQLTEMSKKIDEIDKRLAKMEKVSLKTWDFVYKLRMPGGDVPDETKDMQDEMGAKNKLRSDNRGRVATPEEEQPEEEKPEEEQQ
jgi:hypothetical protein